MSDHLFLTICGWIGHLFLLQGSPEKILHTLSLCSRFQLQHTHTQKQMEYQPYHVKVCTNCRSTATRGRAEAHRESCCNHFSYKHRVMDTVCISQTRKKTDLRTIPAESGLFQQKVRYEIAKTNDFPKHSFLYIIINRSAISKGYQFWCPI